MAHNITSKTGRANLKARREPYWARIRTGLYVGYRKADQGEGTWIARRRNDDGKQQYHALGVCTDFDDAVKGAETWASSVEAGVSQHGTTVSDACNIYVENLRLHKTSASAKDAETRFNRLVHGTSLGRLDLAKLKTSDVKKWLHSQVKFDSEDDEIRKSKDSANRNLNSLKAALNLALKDRLVSTDAGWKTVTTFRDVGRRRDGFIPMDQRKALLDACPSDLRQLVTALLLTGARPGELAKANVQDFDKARGTLTLNGKTGYRVVTLSTAAIRFFTIQIRDRIGNAPLLIREYGTRWDKDAWKKPFKEATKVAGLTSDAVMYSLRHTAISELIAGGMDSFLVARLAGTSTAMIDKHYGHLRHDSTRRQLDAVKVV